MNFLLRIIQAIQCLMIDLGIQPSDYRCEEILQVAGLQGHRHLHNRSIAEHLRGTREILASWNQPGWVAYAGLFHSFYDHDSIMPQSVRFQARPLLRSAIGSKAEKLAYRLSKLPIYKLLQLDPEDENLCTVSLGETVQNTETLDKETLCALLIIATASEIDQATPPGAAPGLWLARVSKYLERIRSISEMPVRFLDSFVFISESDERTLLHNYETALSLLHKDPKLSAQHFEYCTSTCSFLFEPWVWLAYDAALECNEIAVREYAIRAKSAFNSWSIVWDKRLSRCEWLFVIERLSSSMIWDDSVAVILSKISRYVEAPSNVAMCGSSDGAPISEQIANGDVRLLAYLKTLSNQGQDAEMINLYPSIGNKLIYASSAFPILTALERSATNIRSAVMSLPDIYFNEFADQLGTCGKMTTLTFYDSGERRPSTFVLCPRLGELIDGFGDVARGSFGDAYIAKLSPYTYLAPHNGATNISLQAVLPICIPSGKSGVHFENTTITFIEGECCVFDSLARREEWNDSDCECVLFFFSLWHPDISVPERRVLEALHRVIEGHARQLNQRWILNNIHKFTSLQRNLGE